MKNYLLVAMLFLLTGTLQAQNKSFEIKKENLIRSVEVLTSDTLGGRLAGSGYDLKTARYLESQLSAMGYLPLMGESGIVEFEFTTQNGESAKSYNVVMVMKTEGECKNILIGAHYDHLGTIKGKIYRGANDNASGIASLMEIARNISDNRNLFQKNIIICAFGAEECKISGSRELVKQLEENKIKIDFMFNFEMTGTMSEDLVVELLGKDTFDMKRYIDKTENKYSLKIIPQPALYHISDQFYFSRKCPTAVFATTEVVYYHHPKDVMETLDFDGMKKLTHYALNFIFEVTKEL